jgi:SAM-dependent methyltransferase
MERVNCYNCESEENKFYFKENGFILVKCSQCGLLYVNLVPSKEEIDEAVMSGVHVGEKQLNVSTCFNNCRIKEYLNILNRFFGSSFSDSKKTWLDIGCGNGEFIRALNIFSNNIIAKGMEPNINKQITARKRGLDVTYFDLDNHTLKYDFISLLNVYSHLPNPKANLSNWKKLLKPGGELFLETGDTANLNSKEHYKPFNLPDHLIFASEDIVVNILRKIGFEIIEINKFPAFKSDIITIAKEIAIVFLPNKTSRLKYLFNRKLYNTDMYIRARLK